MKIELNKTRSSNTNTLRLTSPVSKLFSSLSWLIFQTNGSTFRRRRFSQLVDMIALCQTLISRCSSCRRRQEVGGQFLETRFRGWHFGILPCLGKSSDYCGLFGNHLRGIAATFPLYGENRWLSAYIPAPQYILLENTCHSAETDHCKHQLEYYVRVFAKIKSTN